VDSVAFSGCSFSPAAAGDFSSAEDAPVEGWEPAEPVFLLSSLQPRPNNKDPLMANETHHFQDFFISSSLM
jgi:hypothetical protein